MRKKQLAVTIEDVARVAGVSVSTASRVLNNKDDVAPETFEKVRRVMQDLNYTASLAAKSMRSRTSYVLGLLVPDVTDVYYLEVIKGVGTGMRGSGYDLLIYTREHPMKVGWEQEHVALLSSNLADGCIVVSPTAPEFPDNGRIVIVDPQGNGAKAPSVVARNRMGALAIMEYLIQLGHRRIGFIEGQPETLSAIRRLEGYTDGLAIAGLPFDPALVEPGDFTRERGYAAAQALLSKPNPPTAIFAANDKTAMGVMDLVQAQGLRIPEDVSVVGFDNLPESAQTTPKLTTVDQGIQEMGTVAAKLMLGMLQGEEPVEQLVKVPTRLIIRNSCAPPPHLN